VFLSSEDSSDEDETADAAVRDADVLSEVITPVISPLPDIHDSLLLL